MNTMDQQTEIPSTKLLSNEVPPGLSKRSATGHLARWSLILGLCAASALVMAYFLEENSQPGANGMFAQFEKPNPPFEFENLTLPREEVLTGGPPKDGIPAISKPLFIKPSEATFLKPEDRVIGLRLENIERAYPIAILNYHEIVNDKLGNVPVAVSYCPLCDSAVVFDRRLKTGEREFGVSGLLYNSNVLMYDRGGDPESLWSQMMTRGVSGESVDENLKTLPLELTTWKSWKTRYPDTEVLSEKTGHERDYSKSPYDTYFKRPGLMFPVNKIDKRLPVKTPVLGIWTKKTSRAYPLSAFSVDENNLKQTIDGLSFTLQYEKESHTLRVVQADKGIQYAYSLWFAWYAFHPDTDLYSTIPKISNPK